MIKNEKVNKNFSGKVWIDTKTGLFVKLEDSDGVEVFTVIKIDTENLGIPDYK